MERILTRIFVIILLSAPLLNSCVREPAVRPEPHEADNKLTLEQAMEAFGKGREYAHRHATRTGETLPEFTPLWDKARAVHGDVSSAMSVPILSDKIITVADIRRGIGNYSRGAVVTRELYIVKNYESGGIIPTVKTTVPLDGTAAARDPAYSPEVRNAVVYYTLLSGEVINIQLIEDGRESMHAYMFQRENRGTLKPKLERIYKALEGLTLMVNRVRDVGTRNGSQWPICVGCGKQHDPLVLCNEAVPVYFCGGCGEQYWPGINHVCRNNCYNCGANYIVPYTEYACCNPRLCPLCNEILHGHRHGMVTGFCNVCRQTIFSLVHQDCPGEFCILCGTAPCGGRHGGGGGTTPPPPSPPQPPPPDPDNPDLKINPFADDNLKGEMEIMLGEFTDTELGALLLSKLNELLKAKNKFVNLKYTVENKPPQYKEGYLGQTIYGYQGTDCYIYVYDLPTMYEELGHAFQYYNHWHDNNINREMEVKMMVYDFCEKNDIRPFGNPYDWEIIDKYSRGEVSSARAVRALKRLGYENANDFDKETFHKRNLEELRNGGQ